MTLKFERIICIDPSLRCSGWAMFRVESRQLIGIGNVRALGSDELMPKRLLDLHTKIARLFSQLDLSTNDVLICEDTTTMIDPSSAIKVEQVRGTFETLARSAGINVPGRIHPRTVQHELLGLRGKQLERSHVKSLAVQAVLQLRSNDLKSLNFSIEPHTIGKQQDIVDAILLGEIALARLMQSQQTGLSLEEIFAEKRLNSKRLKALAS